MADYTFVQADFENPPPLEVFLEDTVKAVLGGPLCYNRHIKKFGLRGDEVVLDFGCGSGVAARSMAKQLRNGGRLVCLDTSQFWIERARQRLREFDNVEYKRGDIRELNLPRGTFEVIAVFHVLHDIPPGERQSTVQTLAATLKRDGALQVNEPTRISHGIAVAEIRRLMAYAGLVEVEGESGRSAYTGTFALDGRGVEG